MSFLSRDTTLAAAFGAATLIGGSGAASAATIQSFSVNPYPGSQTVSLDQFNATGLHLTEVDFSFLEPSYGAGAALVVTGGEGGDTFTAGLTTTLAAKIAGLSNLSLWSATASTLADICVGALPGGPWWWL